MQTVAIVEDNKAVRDAVSAYLKVEDFSVVEFDSGFGVPDYIKNANVDLALMDITLPDSDGFYLVKTIRKFSNIPIIFLSSKFEESDRILGFELGCDDYIQKPFSHRELILRIKAVLKRSQFGVNNNVLSDSKQYWSLGKSSIKLNLPGHEFLLNDKPVKFTSTEWKIITYLISNYHIVLSREQILDHSMEYQFEGYDRIVDTHIKNIRSKLGDECWIETVRGYGYSFKGRIQS